MAEPPRPKKGSPHYLCFSIYFDRFQVPEEIQHLILINRPHSVPSGNHKIWLMVLLICIIMVFFGLFFSKFKNVEENIKILLKN
jgi:undecaprenyl pyrophosphate phosphatase UppP